MSVFDTMASSVLSFNENSSVFSDKFKSKIEEYDDKICSAISLENTKVSVSVLPLSKKRILCASLGLTIHA